MTFQDVIILGLAIAALALSIISIVFAIIFFRMQMQQSRSMIKDTSDFTQQMNILLNDIRTSQNVTGQQVKDQYDKLLDAALHSNRGSIDVAATSAVQFGEFGDRIDSLAKAVAELKDPGKVEAQIKELRRAEEALNTTVRQLATQATEREVGLPKPTASRFEKFSEKARRVLAIAEKEARNLHHNYIGTEHLLLGLLGEEEGVAAKVLVNLKISLGKVRSAVEFIIGRGEKPSSMVMGLTLGAKKAIELAIDEAQQLGHNYIGTEHLIIGLLREDDGIASSVLDSFGATIPKVRAEVKKITQKDK